MTDAELLAIHFRDLMLAVGNMTNLNNTTNRQAVTAAYRKALKEGVPVMQRNLPSDNGN